MIENIVPIIIELKNMVRFLFFSEIVLFILSNSVLCRISVGVVSY